MLACRPRSQCLSALSHLCVAPTRSTSTSSHVSTASDQATPSTSQLADNPSNSIFTTPESPWDHVFSDIEPPPVHRLRPRFSAKPTAPTARKPGDRDQQFLRRASNVRRQRASLTAREMSVFDDMFDLIFSAVSRKGKKASAGDAGAGAHAGQTASIGRAGAGTGLDDLFRTLRRHTSRARWTTEIDEELDRKKETMELFNTDHELLQWVTLELFGHAQKWDEEAKRAIAASGGTRPTLAREKDSKAHVSEGDSTASSPSPSTSSGDHGINHSIYPHLIAHAMRLFRTTYSNPSLSLAVFNHAARVSIPSYVFGCTAPAYNELIEAKWEGWGDLKGVCGALEEMRANGVKIDGRTRIVVENVRKEVGEARPAELGESGEEPGQKDEAGDVKLDGTGTGPFARRAWRTLGEAEVMRLLSRIERLALREPKRKTGSKPHEESWKAAVLQPSEDDGWSFDDWEEKEPRGGRKPVREGTDDTIRRNS